MKTFGWLLKREYWEHRGGFLWAQVWTAGLMLLALASLLVIGGVFASHIQGRAGFFLADAGYIRPDRAVLRGVFLPARRFVR